ncbi:MAG: radical SAM protein [Planctomycetota bacterium]
MIPSPSDDPPPPAFRADRHPRELRDYRYVYAVLSRRANGLSVGVNLNLDKRCSFNCLYCQVERRCALLPRETIDMERLAAELDGLLRDLTDGTAFNSPPFDSLPVDQRVIKDIAFSGDGEPTAVRQFPDCVRAVADALRKAGIPDTRVTLITNATGFRLQWMADGLDALSRLNSEIWAKLDAGTVGYYRRVNRSNASFDRILENIAHASRFVPVALQTMLMTINGEPPADAEIDAYIDRVRRLLSGGATILRILLYTVSRPPADSSAAALSGPELRRFAGRISAGTGLPVETF